MTADQKFQALSTEIPPPLIIPGDLSFCLVRVSGNIAYLSGHGPNRSKRPPEFDYAGKVGGKLSIGDGYAAARLVGLNLLVSLRNAIGSLDHVTQVLHVVGAINSERGFTGQSFVLNGCSDLFVSIFGDRGKPTRMAFGAYELPFGMAVEASMIVEISQGETK